MDKFLKRTVKECKILSNFHKTCTTNAHYCALYGLMKMEHTTFAHWPPPLLKNCNYPGFFKRVHNTLKDYF
jgi:hypothetical protein